MQYWQHTHTDMAQQAQKNSPPTSVSNIILANIHPRETKLPRQTWLTLSCLCSGHTSTHPMNLHAHDATATVKTPNSYCSDVSHTSLHFTEYGPSSECGWLSECLGGSIKIEEAPEAGNNYIKNAFFCLPVQIFLSELFYFWLLNIFLWL